MSLFVNIKKRIGDFCLDVSLETSGGVSGLLGASGSGKSMTLMCIAGIVRPDRPPFDSNETSRQKSPSRFFMSTIRLILPWPSFHAVPGG
jgi:ABC-type molybdate transport system ATPase subunit